ncbi:TPA: bifunctional chorismate mutase/prephenate dehydrogenase, partial [Candidatus Geothermarchaeota archaeon]|nr:bifunctional chorismate mutase/prephenate dehydrogenase [Candidatus Geothermarchaeota archaeon]
MEIGRIKRGLGIDIYDPKREREVIEKAGEYARIYMEILRYSRMIQQGEIDLNMDNSIGIVGYGRMGRLFTEIFRRYFRDVIIYDIKRDIKPPKNVIAVDKLEELVKDSDYIMVSTPLTNIHESIASIRRLVIELDLKGKTIFDIATIKYRVIPELSKYPDTVNVASIHPMFGPEIESHIGRKILIMDVPGKEGGADKLINLFSKIGFRTIETDYISH